MTVDPHTHSSISDGTQSPTELLRAARAAGVDVLGLTDHDTSAGWAEAEAAVATTGVSLLRGSEISCSASGISVHLLSYLHDPDDPVLAAELARARASRVDRARLMVERVAEDYPLTWADVEAQLEPGATVGRPHIADALVALGHVPDRSAAFASILSAAGPYYVRYYAPDVIAAVRAVRAAGGVPVMAHPFASVRGRVVAVEVIEAMADAGLAGLEVDHRDQSPAERAELRAIARRLGLFTTGSSDYHGAGKPNRLAEHTTTPEVLAAIEEAGRLPVVRP
ncbi:PHP domain-containing protein [Georgenia faecalis]|uniref:PHP domain-containing protein n=1 Tax=Georgenia faecalis TaxID=2483799 RepID=A0ABV9D6E0_9MICO|nr:PHP domain-containing protein [Georgenia faecalis]